MWHSTICTFFFNIRVSWGRIVCWLVCSINQWDNSSTLCFKYLQIISE